MGVWRSKLVKLNIDTLRLNHATRNLGIYKVLVRHLQWFYRMVLTFYLEVHDIIPCVKNIMGNALTSKLKVLVKFIYKTFCNNREEELLIVYINLSTSHFCPYRFGIVIHRLLKFLQSGWCCC